MTPQVRIVAKTVAIIEGGDESRELSAGEFIAYAARVSNPSNQMNSQTYDQLINYLMNHSHWSPFEMSSITMEVVTTRDIAHQFIRHHSFRFQEFSQRYAESLRFHTDFNARSQDKKNRQNSFDDMTPEVKSWWKQVQEDTVRECNDRYRRALEKGIAKELARKVLPEGLTETTFYATGNIRSWLHYLAQRLDVSAQQEHRDVATACLEQLVLHVPEVFKNVR